MAIRYYDPEKVRWLGHEVTEEEAMKSSIHDRFWRYAVIMSNGFEYSSFDVSMQEGKDAIAQKSVERRYSVDNYYRFPFQYSHFFFGGFAYENPCLP